MKTYPMPLRGQKRTFGDDSERDGTEDADDTEVMSGLPQDMPSAQSFSDVMRVLVEGAEEDELLPGALDDEPADLEATAPASGARTAAGASGSSQSSPTGSASRPGSTSAQPQDTRLRVRIRIPQHLIEKEALKLRNLFPRIDDLPSSSRSIFNEFWSVGQNFLSQEEALQDSLHAAATTNSGRDDTSPATPAS
ncbi:hypothetical protein C8Q72DRAFT_369608 [Fomitopsis betulina]|nr:hypothetical protein C8Q72DRAFT_369608 [Fomitopsis betulina]